MTDGGADDEDFVLFSPTLVFVYVCSGLLIVYIVSITVLNILNLNYKIKLSLKPEISRFVPVTGIDIVKKVVAIDLVLSYNVRVGQFDFFNICRIDFIIIIKVKF